MLSVYSLAPWRRVVRHAVVTLLLLAGVPAMVQAAEGGYWDHEAEPQKGDLYAGHFLKKEYAQSRISHLNDYSNHTWITLEGNITAHNADDTYQFRDTTGDITLSIKPDAWHGHEVNAIEVVRVSGFLTRQDVDLLLVVDEINLP